jgi:hypothetical protein
VIKFFLLKKASIGAVDQWYWLKYKDAVKVQKKCPPDLPNYLLEIKQWYPPVFGWFLSQIPNELFKYTTPLTQFLSLFRLSFIILLAYSTNQENSLSLWLATVIYLTAPVLIYYDNQINSRIFGAILVDILILLFLGYFEYGLSYLLFPILLITLLLLFTHKMSHQLYLFLLFGLSLYYFSIIPILIYIVSNIVAIYLFGYRKYLKHHIEIVKFWHRHRYKLGAHQFYESKIYGRKDFVYSNRLHGDGIKSFFKKSYLMIGMLPFSIFILFNFQLNFFTIIILATILFILLTSFVDSFLCLGAGSLYNYNLVTFIGFYLVYVDIDYGNRVNQLLLLIVSIMTIVSIYKFYRGLKSKKEDEEFNEALNYLKKSDLDRVMVIPFQLPDEVTYKINKKVFWGGHGYGFLWLEPYFPVFNSKIESTIDDWNLGAIFLKKDYFPEFFESVDMSLYDIDFENDEYIIFSVKEWENREKIPQWAIEKYPDIFGANSV